MIRKILPCVLALMCVLCLPSVALAVGGEPKVNWSEDGDICRIWITRNNTPDYPCENQYDAASWMLGVNPARLTEEQKTKLSNQSSGGQFWAFAQAVEGSTGDDFDLGLYPGLPAFQTIYGNYYYAVECDKSLFYAAQNDLHVILSGGSLGGGGGSSGDYVYYDCVPTGWDNPTYDGVVGVALYGSYVECLKKTIEVNSGYDLKLWIGLGQNTKYVTLHMLDKMPIINVSNYTFNWPGTGTYGFNSVYPDSGFWQGKNSSIVEHDGKKYVLAGPDPSSVYAFSVGANNNGNVDACRPLFSYYWGDVDSGGGGGGGGSDTFWPNPTGGEPDPPTPPEPVDPVPPDPVPPTPPDLPDPYMPIVEPEPTGTEPIDYTPWFRAILRELQNFHRDNIAVLNAINSQIVSSSNAIIADLNYMLDYGLGQLHDEFSATRAYLRECLEWLAEQMDFSFTADGYDDTSVVSYLKQILYELQKAPDVTTNPFDFFGWLNGLLGNLLSGLLGAVLGSLASFTEPLEALTGKFPFSLPWDIAAILALFVAPAQVPIFDIPFAGYGSVHVDLTGFDVVAQVVRALMLVFFAYGLTQRTKDMLDLIDKIVG